MSNATTVPAADISFDVTALLCDLMRIEDTRTVITAADFEALALAQTTDIANRTDDGTNPSAEEGIYCIVVERLRGEYRVEG